MQEVSPGLRIKGKGGTSNGIQEPDVIGGKLRKLGVPEARRQKQVQEETEINSINAAERSAKQRIAHWF